MRGGPTISYYISLSSEFTGLDEKSDTLPNKKYETHHNQHRVEGAIQLLLAIQPGIEDHQAAKGNRLSGI